MADLKTQDPLLPMSHPAVRDEVREARAPHSGTVDIDMRIILLVVGLLALGAVLFVHIRNIQRAERRRRLHISLLTVAEAVAAQVRSALRQKPSGSVLAAAQDAHRAWLEKRTDPPVVEIVNGSDGGGAGTGASRRSVGADPISSAFLATRGGGGGVDTPNAGGGGGGGSSGSKCGRTGCTPANVTAASFPVMWSVLRTSRPCRA